MNTPVIIKEGVQTVARWFVVVKVKWVIQNNNHNLELLIEGHKVLTLDGVGDYVESKFK